MRRTVLAGLLARNGRERQARYDHLCVNFALKSREHVLKVSTLDVKTYVCFFRVWSICGCSGAPFLEPKWLEVCLLASYVKIPGTVPNSGIQCQLPYGSFHIILTNFWQTRSRNLRNLVHMLGMLNQAIIHMKYE